MILRCGKLFDFPIIGKERAVDIRSYRYPEKLNIEKSAVALGYFDGVHVGHRKLISLLVREAKARNIPSYILTFADNISITKKTQSIIYNTEEKIKIFESLGVDGVIIADFDSIKELSAESFVCDVLIDALGAEIAISGYNFRFGKEAKGDADTLVELMGSQERSAMILDEQKIGNDSLSSTAIRELLSKKKLEEATRMLGAPYFIEGMVEKGLGLGKVYGFPTVNTQVRESTPLPSGVYRTAVEIDGKLYTGVTNVGSCPTVKEREIHAETLIADFDGNLYGKNIRIYFLGFLRDEKRFDSIEKLKKQIYLDRDKSIEENGDLKWLETGPNLL